MGILILAANTSFADFPRLSSILARDGYFPRQFAYRGERLAFNAGIVALALVSIVVLVVAFGGDVNALIPLYAIGRVHRLHPVAGGHGPPLVRRARAPAGGGAPSSTASAR